MKSFALTDIPEFSDDEKIIVVGIVGKSPYNRITKTKSLQCEFTGDECGIECFWNESQSVLYLHLSSLFDTRHLLKFIDNLGKDNDKKWSGSDGVNAARKAGDFLVSVGDMTTDLSISLLLMFHLCHVIVLSTPTAVFDLEYINLFKSIDSIRVEMQPKIGDLIGSLVGQDWANQGRPCCPRVLFYFDTCPRQFYKAETSQIKILEHSLEDQIYNILRKARVITNISANSLFAIPNNEEFVYVNSGDIPPGNELSDMVRSLVVACEGTEVMPEWGAEITKRETFGQFLQTHLDLAFSSGFDDNVGKFAMSSSFFEVPSAPTWRKVATILSDLFFSPNSDHSWTSLWDSLSIDTMFSQGRCAKVLPLAQATYMEGLPSHYSTQHHSQRVAVAVSVFSSVAPGPLSDWYRGQLEENCNKIWESRRLCEKSSLTGNPCIKPKHSLDSEDVHSSGVRYVAACNCGRTKGSRDDPYTVRWSNFEFYAELAKDCQCGTSTETISFPVFQPSINDFRAASVKSGLIVPVTTPGSGANSPTEWSQPSQDEGLSNVALSETNVEPSTNNLSSADPFTLIAIDEVHYKDKGLVRQPSTTEYLPGMLHVESPPGLLPAFSSWSLVCLGPSSLYSHSIGLPEHLHPGFLQHTNYLLPWDCSISTANIKQVGSAHSRESASSWSRTLQRGGMRGKPQPSHYTVKIFLGMEYECPRGHRFMMSSSDTIINGSTLLKESGAKLASSDMPVYYHCPCRLGKPMVAQLMRVHIVTPKAHVGITLNPKIQPTASGPIFITGGECPVRLSGSAYWVLRLPYIFSTERGALPRPSAPLAALARGKLLQGMIGVTD